MKYATFITFLGTVIAASTANNPVETPKKLKPMPAPSLTQGNTKITLIHLARTTSWSNQFVNGHENQQGPIYAIPGVYMEFLFEQVDKTSDESDRNISTVKLIQNGRVLSGSKPIIKGGDGGIEQYLLNKQRFGFKRPKISDTSKAYIMWDFQRGISLEAGKVTIQFEAGSNQETHLFEFKDIPLY